MIHVKKGNKLEIEIEKIIFPNTGIAHLDDKEIRVKDVLPGQIVKVLIKKKKKNYYQARLLEVVKKSHVEIKARCKHYKDCGGCNRQSLEYEEQIRIKEKQIQELFYQSQIKVPEFLGIIPSPQIFEYRNKMEFSFGDLKKGGTLQLGMHPRGKRFDVVTVESCKLIDQDFRKILSTVINYFRSTDLKKYHVISHQGYLRNLVIRKGINTGEILINLITTSQNNHNLSTLKKKLIEIKLEGKIVGFLQTINDDFADTVKCEKLIIYYGRPYFYEKLSNLTFKITPFAFFQTNSKGAEILYNYVIDFINNMKNKILVDLYCGTGTISQMVARNAERVIGIEINKEAVQMACQNARLNKINNCHFIAGDVLEKIDILEKLNKFPDLIILDPPRPGINPRALEKIINYNVKEIIYISCNPRSLIRDLKSFLSTGYQVNKVRCIDMFPHTHHIESIVHLYK